MPFLVKTEGDGYLSKCLYPQTQILSLYLCYASVSEVATQVLTLLIVQGSPSLLLDGYDGVREGELSYVYALESNTLLKEGIHNSIETHIAYRLRAPI